MKDLIKIKRVDVFKLNIKRSQPTRIALGLIDSVQNIAIKITADNGQFGWGEASPYAPITGDSQDSNYLTAQQMAPLLMGKCPLAISARMVEINAFTRGEPSIRAAFDIALFDLSAKIAGVPLYAFLGGQQRMLRTDMTIGLQETVAETLMYTDAIITAGFDAIKLKVGRANLEDVAHATAVRERVGPNVSIKIDSNQGWSYPEAVANIHAMRSINLQYSEQPVAAWDSDSLKRLREKVSIPICADESVFDHHDAIALVNASAVDYLNIKLGKSGGIATALKINAVAEAAGCQCMIGCFSESRLALSAAGHLVMARPNIKFLDLDSALKHRDDPVVGGITYDDQIGGLIHVPDRPGHGAEFDEAALSDRVSIA